MGHLEKHEIEDLHKKGGCLARHEPKYEAKNPCSHKWQGHKKGKEDSGTYNYPAYAKLCANIVKKDYKTETNWSEKLKIPYPYQDAFSKRQEEGYWRRRPTKEGKEWDLDYKDNFQVQDRPYWNNKHHIIPYAELNECIDRVADKMNDSNLAVYIRDGLMADKYNLNDRANMIILPQEQIVGDALMLPCHRLGHSGYIRNIKKELMDVIRAYAKKYKRGCQNKDPKLKKKFLVDLSKRNYRIFKLYGRRGRPLDQLPVSG